MLASIAASGCGRRFRFVDEDEILMNRLGPPWFLHSSTTNYANAHEILPPHSCLFVVRNCRAANEVSRIHERSGRRLWWSVMN
jgi:hypothetical protein